MLGGLPRGSDLRAQRGVSGEKSDHAAWVFVASVASKATVLRALDDPQQLGLFRPCVQALGLLDRHKLVVSSVNQEERSRRNSLNEAQGTWRKLGRQIGWNVDAPARHHEDQVDHPIWKETQGLLRAQEIEGVGIRTLCDNGVDLG